MVKNNFWVGLFGVLESTILHEKQIRFRQCTVYIIIRFRQCIVYIIIRFRQCIVYIIIRFRQCIVYIINNQLIRFRQCIVYIINNRLMHLNFKICIYFYFSNFYNEKINLRTDQKVAIG